MSIPQGERIVRDYTEILWIYPHLIYINEPELRNQLNIGYSDYRADAIDYAFSILSNKQLFKDKHFLHNSFIAKMSFIVTNCNDYI
jgi:hypothetical protein